MSTNLRENIDVENKYKGIKCRDVEDMHKSKQSAKNTKEK